MFVIIMPQLRYKTSDFPIWSCRRNQSRWELQIAEKYGRLTNNIQQIRKRS